MLNSRLRVCSRAKAKLRDTSGSSIILALAFFIICAIIGTIVLTVASVNTKATVTYEKTQQAEYTVTSAANLIGEQLANSSATWTYPGSSKEPDFAMIDSYAPDDGLVADLWKRYGSMGQASSDGIWASYQKASYVIPQQFIVSAPGLDDVYVDIEFDRDLNITATLSLDSGTGSSGASSSKGYDMVVSVQATPHFDISGKLLGVDWGSYTVSKAASLAAPAAGSTGGATA